MDNFLEFFKQAPKIIAEAAKRPLGIVALAILALSVLALGLFAYSPDLVKIAIFIVLVVAFCFFAFAAMRRLPEVRKEVKDSTGGEKLAILFEKTHPFLQTENVKNKDAGGFKIHWCRIGVLNNSRDKTIRHVRVELVNMGGYHNDYLPAILKPRYYSNDNIDLPPRKTEYINVAALIEKNTDSELTLCYHNKNFANVIPKKKYKIKLKVYGDDVLPSNRFFSLKVNKKTGELKFGPWLKKQMGHNGQE